MDSKARHELSRAIQREGVGLFENPQRIKALLLDACPESRMEIGLLVQAAEDEIPARLARSSESVFRDTEIARAVAELKKTRRLDDGAAEWVVRSWAWALGVLDTEPSDDVGDTPSVPLTPSDPFGGQAASPPYPSVPSDSGAAASFPPAGSGSQSGPGPYSEPWQSRVTSGSQPPGPAPGGAPWVTQPTFPGSAAGSWGGPPPPVNTGWGAAPPPPPPGLGRRRLYAVLGAVAVVIVLAVVGVVIIDNTGSEAALPPPSPAPQNPGSSVVSSPPSVPPSTEPVAPPAPTEPEPDKINFTITNSLGDFEVAETAIVYSFGERVGELRVNRSQPNDRLLMEGHGTNIDVQLKITYVGTDGEQYKLSSAGTISVYEGAVFAVVFNWDSAGNPVADLEPQQGGI